MSRYLQALEKSSTILPEKPWKGHIFHWAVGFIPISQEMRYRSKVRKRSHFSQFGQALTWSSWQPLLLLKLQVSSLGSTTPASRRQRLSVMRTPVKQFRTPQTPSRSGSKNNDPHPRRMLSPALVTPEAGYLMHSRSLRILQPCSSHILAAGWSMHSGSLRIPLSKYQWIFIVNPGLYP